MNNTLTTFEDTLTIFPRIYSWIYSRVKTWSQTLLKKKKEFFCYFRLRLSCLSCLCRWRSSRSLLLERKRESCVLRKSHVLTGGNNHLVYCSFLPVFPTFGHREILFLFQEKDEKMFAHHLLQGAMSSPFPVISHHYISTSTNTKPDWFWGKTCLYSTQKTTLHSFKSILGQSYLASYFCELASRLILFSFSQSGIMFIHNAYGYLFFKHETVHYFDVALNMIPKANKERSGDMNDWKMILEPKRTSRLCIKVRTWNKTWVIVRDSNHRDRYQITCFF